MNRLDMFQKTIRLNKFIAQNGIASRRGADALVFNGKVTLNGMRADSPGLQIDPNKDVVTVHGKTIMVTKEKQSSITFILNKPIQTVTTANDPQGRETVLDLLPLAIQNLRPFPVGRLDFFSEGLLLLTTDGDLCYRLTHPKFHLPKTYRVIVREAIPEKFLTDIQNGMVLSDGTSLAPAKISIRRSNPKQYEFDLTLIQGVNRQIRRMCEEYQLTVLRLKRITQGPLSLGNLQPGQWRELTSSEMDSLRKAVDLY